MHRLTPFVILLLALQGCTSFQYLTVDSPQMTKDPNHELSWENDTLRISYVFHGNGGPVKVSIYNKTTQSLFVNWKRSAFIRDNRSIVLYNPRGYFFGEADGYGYSPGDNVQYTRATIKGAFTQSEGMDFIPPSTGISKNLLYLGGTGNLHTQLPDSAQPQTVRQRNGFKIKYREVGFDEARSQIRFSTYLTFALGPNNGHEFTETHSFYVNRVVQTTQAPESLDMYRAKEDQLFVIRR